MKLRYEIDIDAGRDAVWAMLSSNELRPRWQASVASVNSVSGSPDAIGHVRRVTGTDGRQDVLESITELRRPDFIAVIAEGADHKALVVDRLEASAARRTKWQRWSNVRFRGLKRFSAAFAAGRLRDRMIDDMNRFKLLAETEAESA